MSTLDPQELGIRLEAMRMGLNEAESSEAAVQAAQQYYDFLTNGSQPGDEQRQAQWFREGWKNALQQVRKLSEAYKGTGEAHSAVRAFVDDQLKEA